MKTGVEPRLCSTDGFVVGDGLIFSRILRCFAPSQAVRLLGQKARRQP